MEKTFVNLYKEGGPLPLYIFYPALTGSNAPTSNFGECEEVRWEITAHKNPIGSTNN